MLKHSEFIAIIFSVAVVIFTQNVLVAAPAQTEHFRIMGFGGEISEADIKRIATDLESSYKEIAILLGVDPYRFSKIEVNVYKKPQAGRHIRAGATEETIDLDANFNDIATLKHELTHIVIAKAMPSAPTWFHEGLAQYISEGDIRKAKEGDIFPIGTFSFAKLEADFESDVNEDEAYYYSWSIVTYLIDKYGKEKLQVLFKESGFFKDRFVKAYGIELKTLEEKSNEIFSKYKPKGR